MGSKLRAILEQERTSIKATIVRPLFRNGVYSFQLRFPRCPPAHDNRGLPRIIIARLSRFGKDRFVHSALSEAPARPDQRFWSPKRRMRRFEDSASPSLTHSGGGLGTPALGPILGQDAQLQLPYRSFSPVFWTFTCCWPTLTCSAWLMLMLSGCSLNHQCILPEGLAESALAVRSI